MSRRNRTRARQRLALVCAAFVALASVVPARGSTILLKDGRQLQGKIGKTSSLAENPLSPKPNAVPAITFVDDNLRRTFLPSSRIQQILEAEAGERQERIELQQRVARVGNRVQRVGPISAEPFDKMGRRVVTMLTDKGPLQIIQGITEITPSWTKVEGLSTVTRTPLIWDMRIATSSIPPDTLDAVLTQATDPKSLDARIRVVRLLLQAERYKDAQQKLEAVIRDFPGQQQLAAQVQAIRQLYGRTVLGEIEVRQKAGQHALAYSMLESFPTENIASETLQQVREMLDEYQQTQKRLEKLYHELKAHIAAISDSDRRRQCEAMLEEMSRELNINTLPRMADYFRLADDPSLGPEEKVSLAISGWLLGSNRGETNLAVTLSLIQVRATVRQFLNEPVKLDRERLLAQLRAQEGASPSLVAALVGQMKPPLETPEPSPAKPGFYQFSVPIGIPEEADAEYCVLLPPQYDPYVRYPTILTLGGLGSQPERQIDWWAGATSESGHRLGQATRRGYIVIAVDWLKDAQRSYMYSAREHSAVLACLRDACRRFSVDTDRVYLTGHSTGGNAVWDMGLAHPDLWAGVLPIAAEAGRFVTRYTDNAAMVPFYFVTGELDGDKTVKNATELDDYLGRRYDVTVNEYIGRGHDDFYEEVLRMFDWMGRRRRDFFPKEFEVSTMRTFDNYFWWFEGRDFPERGMIAPSNWPPQRGVRPLQVKGKILASGGLSLTTGSDHTTLWLSPEMVDFEERVSISVNGRSLKSGGVLVEPDLGVLLEDVRTRGDRQHPFWAKIDL